MVTNYDELPLSNTKVVVFGASAGIGRATAELMASSGADVVAVSRQPPLTSFERIASFPCDGTDNYQVAQLFERVDGFDHLVVSFGSDQFSATFRENGPQSIRLQFEEKFFAYMEIAHAAVSRISPTGSITFVSGAAARSPFIGSSAWAAADGAIDSVVPTLALELAPIRVNAVSPGTVSTRWAQQLTAEKRKEMFGSIAARTPLGRIGNASEIAEAILFLARNSFVTGTVLAIDGGASLKPDPVECRLATHNPI